MPTLISRGAASAKAFGLTNGSLNLTTTTFTSNGTWVAPAGVALVIVLSGRGQDGSPYPLTSNTQYWTFDWPGARSNPPYAQWGDLYGAATSARAAIAATIGGPGPSNVLTSLRYYIGTGSTWDPADENYSDYSGYTVTGVDAVGVGNGSPQTSGNIIYPPGYNSWVFTVYLTAPGFLGASSTALSQTFPGGNSGPAPVTTFNNIAVTPGASYPIVVAPGGYVTIQYLAP